jgi:uncharacterized membrane protein YkoI
MKTLLALTACAGLIASATSSASAQEVAQPGFYKGDVAAFHGNNHTLIDAIHALHATSGQRVVDIRFVRQNGVSGYHVVLQKNGRFSFMHIDEQSGRVVEISESSAPDWMLNWNKRRQLRVDRGAKVTLAQAIRTAESANSNEPAIAAGIAMSASNPTSDVHAYNVILDNQGQTMRVAVDASTGQIIANPSALSDWS